MSRPPVYNEAQETVRAVVCGLCLVVMVLSFIFVAAAIQ